MQWTACTRTSPTMPYSAGWGYIITYFFILFIGLSKIVPFILVYHFAFFWYFKFYNFPIYTREGTILEREHRYTLHIFSSQRIVCAFYLSEEKKTSAKLFLHFAYISKSFLMYLVIEFRIYMKTYIFLLFWGIRRKLKNNLKSFTGKNTFRTNMRRPRGC
jgi:hypothetical protein